MRRFLWTSGVAVTAAMLVAMIGAPALAAKPADKTLVPASGRLAGITGGELLGEEIRQLFEIPTAENPLTGAGDSCFAAGPNGKVLIVWTRPEPPTCTVKPGTPVFLFAFFNECSEVENALQTEAEQRQCAIEGLAQFAANFGFEAILISVDGGPAIDILSDRYLAVSPQMTANHRRTTSSACPHRPRRSSQPDGWRCSDRCRRARTQFASRTRKPATIS